MEACQLNGCVCVLTDKLPSVWKNLDLGMVDIQLMFIKGLSGLLSEYWMWDGHTGASLLHL